MTAVQATLPGPGGADAPGTAQANRTRTPSEYRELRAIVIAEGLLEPQTGYYVLKTAIGVGTIGLAGALAWWAPNMAWIVVSAVLMAFASTQIALLGHDIGHRQGFRGRRSNRLARLLFGGVLLGISHSWWNQKHNQHHANPNHVDKDPDIQFPFLAFDPSQVASLHPLLRPVVAVQAFVFVAVLPFQALNMRLTSLRHLVSRDSKSRPLQLASMALHFTLYAVLLMNLGGAWQAIVFAVVHQGVFGLYNSSVFASNHKGMAMIQEGSRLDFFREQVLTSRNVTGHPVVDFWYGGLNYQIEHHLFPTMPRNRLREAQVIVERFCRERDVPYYATGLFTSYREGFQHLHQIGAAMRGTTAG